MDTALLLLRVAVGLLLIGHGAQKLFGWFGGYGIAARLLQLPEAHASAEDGRSAMGEIINVIAGRVQRGICASGAIARFTLPKVAIDNGPPPGTVPDLTLRFASADDSLSFRLCLHLREQHYAASERATPGAEAYADEPHDDSEHTADAQSAAAAP